MIPKISGYSLTNRYSVKNRPLGESAPSFTENKGRSDKGLKKILRKHKKGRNPLEGSNLTAYLGNRLKKRPGSFHLPKLKK